MTLAAGTRLGPYEIEQMLGSGGMGRVYRALDTRLGRTVALKVLREDTLQPQASLRSRFEREALAASRLSHPHICTLYDVGQHEGVDYLVMEYLEGQTLSQRLRQGGLPLQESLRIAIEVAEALDDAHSAGIVHRDLKPSNVMLTRTGSKLLDFGVAKLLPIAIQDADTNSTTHTHLSVTGALVGTLAYMAPEQLQGRDADARSDVFALGVVLYQMLTDRRPFEGGSSSELLRSMLGPAPASPSALVPACPAEVDHTVARCLARAPDKRWQTARELVTQLRIIARKSEADAASLGRRGLRRALAWTAGGAALLTIVVSLRSLTSEDPWPRSVPRQLTTTPGWEGEPAISPDGGFVAYVSDETGSLDIHLVDVKGGNTLRLTDDPAVDRAPEWLPDGSEVLFVSDRSGRNDLWRVPRLGGGATLVVENAYDPAVSPDGTRIAFVRAGPSGDTRVFVAPFEEPTRARMVSADGQGLWDHRQPAWSPDGEQLAYRAQRDLWVMAADGGSSRRLTTEDESDADPTWSLDGRHVYFSSFREGTSALWRVRVEGGAPQRLTLGSGPEVHPRLSRDGRRLTYSTSLVRSDVVVLDRDRGREMRITGLRAGEGPCLEPDGQAVVFVSDRLGGRFDLWLQKLAGGELHGVAQRLTDQTGTVSKPAWSRDGRWIAYHRVVGGERDIWLVPAEGGSPSRLTDDPAPNIHPAWSPDGTELAFVSEREEGSHVWAQPVRQGRPAGAARRLTSGPFLDEAPAWSPDGGQVAFVRSGGGARGEVWVTPARGERTARRIGTFSRAHRVRWGSPGTLLVSAQWDPPHIEIRRVLLATGEQFSLDPPVLLGQNPGLVDFDVSVDERLLAFAREERRGDIWVLEARNRPFE